MRGSTCTIDARALDAANTRCFSDGTTRASAVPRPSIDGGGRNNFTKSSISVGPMQTNGYYVCKLSHKSYLWLISPTFFVESRGEPSTRVHSRATDTRTHVERRKPEARIDVFLGLGSFL